MRTLFISLYINDIQLQYFAQNTKQNLIKDHIMQCSQENSSAKTRIQRFKQVRIVNLDGSPNPTKIFPWQLEDPVLPSKKLTAANALFRDPEDFFASSLTCCTKFWEGKILRNTSAKLKTKYLRWLKHGISIYDFIKPHTTDKYKGININSKFPESKQFPNHIMPKHKAWVTEEIANLQRYAVIKKNGQNAHNQSVTPNHTSYTPFK